MEVMTLHPDITIGQGVVMEAWLTFILMQTIWGSINSRRRRVLSPSIPIGLAYVVDILAGVRIYYLLTLLYYLTITPVFISDRKGRLCFRGCLCVHRDWELGYLRSQVSSCSLVLCSFRGRVSLVPGPFSW